MSRIQYSTRRLEDPNEIVLAKNLIYQVYVGHLKWSIEKNNRSGLEIVQSGVGPFWKTSIRRFDLGRTME
jgi:hypothetical protein